MMQMPEELAPYMLLYEEHAHGSDSTPVDLLDVSGVAVLSEALSVVLWSTSNTQTVYCAQGVLYRLP